MTTHNLLIREWKYKGCVFATKDNLTASASVLGGHPVCQVANICLVFERIRGAGGAEPNLEIMKFML